MSDISSLPTFMANRGNLMQHWTLCELLSHLRSRTSRINDLHYVDAYSMAPFSRPKARRRFDTRHIFVRAANRLRQLNEAHDASRYDMAWMAATTEPVLMYPSSAIFVSNVWEQPVSYSLCEVDRHKCSLIMDWGVHVVRDFGCIGFQVNCRRWQNGLTLRHHADAQLIQLDPNGYVCTNAPDPSDWMIYPNDIERIVQQTQDVEKVALMISSYNSRTAESADDIDNSITPLMTQGGYQRLWRIEGDANTVSLVYTKGVAAPANPDAIPQAWDAWLSELN